MVSANWNDRANPAVKEMIHLAQTALALDGNDPEGIHWTSWIIAVPGGDLNGGIALINKSIDLNTERRGRNWTRLASCMPTPATTESAISHLERSGRLNPRRPAPLVFTLCMRSHISW